MMAFCGSAVRALLGQILLDSPPSLRYSMLDLQTGRTAPRHVQDPCGGDSVSTEGKGLDWEEKRQKSNLDHLARTRLTGSAEECLREDTPRIVRVSRGKMTLIRRSRVIAALTTRIQIFGRMVRFSHTVFALPFALGAVILAQRTRPLTPRLLFWILIAMAGARSAAMGFNRIAEREIDRANPRTAGRELPAGVISLKAALGFVGISSLVFMAAT
jgi:hypothetical protein